MNRFNRIIEQQVAQNRKVIGYSSKSATSTPRRMQPSNPKKPKRKPLTPRELDDLRHRTARKIWLPKTIRTDKRVKAIFG